MTNPFQQATKKKAFLRMALYGPSGSGKTYTALTIATALMPNAKIALIDTEHGSASKYADMFQFDTIELTTFAPQNYIDFIRAAEQNGYDVLIIDSLTHAWSGIGGVLEIVDKAAAQAKGNSYVGWGKGTPEHNRLIEAILAANLHVIGTMRSKTEYVLEVDERTKKTAPRKVGLAPIQRDGMEYEFDVVAEMDRDNTLLVQKSRCSGLHDAMFPKPGGKIAHILRDWLSDGAEPGVAHEGAEQPEDTPKPERPTKRENDGVPGIDDGKGNGDPRDDQRESYDLKSDPLWPIAFKVFDIAESLMERTVSDQPDGLNWGWKVYERCEAKLGYPPDDGKTVKATLGVDSLNDWDGPLGEMLIALIDHAPQAPE